MVTANFILSKLPPYKGEYSVISNNQSISDIKTGILKKFNQTKKDYDLISEFFLGNSLKQTCFNVWQFLRNNVINVTETSKLQTVKTPAAIIATGKTTGSDCKNYALFAAGVLASLVRQGKLNATVKFRFCKYKNVFGGVNDHVFVVAENSNNQYFIDCVKEVTQFNEDTRPDYFSDIKLTNMALASVSGIPNNKILDNLKKERLKGLASNHFKVDSPLDKRYQAAISKMEKMGDVNDVVNSDVIQTVANSIFPGGGAVLSLISSIASTFDNSTDKWKTLVKKLNPLTPQERLNYFYQLIDPAQGGGHFLMTQLYSGYKSHRTQFDDTDKLDFKPALLYNVKINDAFYHDRDVSRIANYGYEGFLDLSRTKNIPKGVNLLPPGSQGYAKQFKQIAARLYGSNATNSNSSNNTSTNDTVATGGGVSPLLLLGGGLLAAKALKLF